MNEYHMLAHIIIRNKVDDFGTICSRLYSIYWFCVFHTSKLKNIYSYTCSMKWVQENWMILGIFSIFSSQEIILCRVFIISLSRRLIFISNRL